MPIIVSWQDEPQAIVSSQFVGNWNMKQYKAAWKCFHEILIDRPAERVDFVVDLRQSILIPPHFVREFRMMPFDPQPNVGMVIFVGVDEPMQLLIDTLLRWLNYPFEIGFADSGEEAEDRIMRARRALQSLSA